MSVGLIFVRAGLSIIVLPVVFILGDQFFEFTLCCILYLFISQWLACSRSRIFEGEVIIIEILAL